jgi:hypothetical protein
MNLLGRPALLIRETRMFRGALTTTLIARDKAGNELWRRHGKEVRRACAKLRGTPLRQVTIK